MAAARDLQARADLVDDLLARAVVDELLVMHYQPRVRLHDGGIVGFEALMRLRSPRGELLTPSDFLARADEVDVLEGLEHAALAAVCRQGAHWAASGSRLVASLNLSTQRLGQLATFEPVIAAALAEHRLPPDQLILEISGGALDDLPGESVSAMRRVAERGVRFSVGTSGPDLTALLDLGRFPIAEIKIGRPAVASIASDPATAAMVGALASLARSRAISCAAEGVESASQHACLLAAGITLAQGYYYERPLSAASFTELIKQPTGVVDAYS